MMCWSNVSTWPCLLAPVFHLLFVRYCIGCLLNQFFFTAPLVCIIYGSKNYVPRPPPPQNDTHFFPCCYMPIFTIRTHFLPLLLPLLIYFTHPTTIFPFIFLLTIFLSNCPFLFSFFLPAIDMCRNPELGTRFFLRFALALLRSWAELFALALSRSFFGLKFRAFVFALPRSLIFRAPRFFALFSRS